MKIVSYNISSCTQDKVDQLFKMDADVYVIPEIAADIKNTLSDEYDMEFIGEYKPKGLGVIWRKEKGKLAEGYNDKLSYAIPIVYDGILILGFWPTKKPNEKTNYTKIATAIIEYYTPLINKYDKCIITGDFNLYKSKDADITKIDSILKDLKLNSVYHSKTGEAFGSETKKTFYFRYNAEQPFFLDYTYSKMSVQKYELLDWDKKNSDHVCQIIEL